MYCSNCGNKLNDNDKFCGNCGSKIGTTDNFTSNNMQNSVDTKKANNLCLISLMLLVGPYILGYIINSIIHLEMDFAFRNMLSNLSAISFLASIVLMIYTKVKFPKNVFAKVIMWIYIVIGIMIIAFFVIVMVACNAAVNSCDIEGCSNEACDTCRALE